MKKITEDDWIATYRPKPAPVPGSSFDFGDGDTLIDGHRPEEVQALIEATEGCIWTVIDGDEGETAIVSGRHFVNRIGYIVTEVPATEDIEVDLD